MYPAATFDKQQVCKLVQRQVDGIYGSFPLRLFSYPWFLDLSFYNGIITIFLGRNIAIQNEWYMMGLNSKLCPVDTRLEEFGKLKKKRPTKEEKKGW